MSIKFYYSPMSSATRVQWALEEIGAPYEKVRVDLTKAEQKAASFLAVNPNGKVPAMTDGDAKMFESLALIFYVADSFGVEKGLWPKSGTPERGEAYTWAVWGTAEVAPAIYQVALHTSDRPWAFPAEKKSAHVAEHGRAAFARCMGVLEERLATREYILGKHFSLVDVANASLGMMATMIGGLSLDAFPKVQAWLARCTSRPAFGRVMADGAAK